MALEDREQAGFAALVSYQTKLGLTEGLVLGGGAALAVGFAWAASRQSAPLSEDYGPWERALERDVEKILLDSQAVQGLDPWIHPDRLGFQKWKLLVEEISKNVEAYDLDLESVKRLFETEHWKRLAPHLMSRQPQESDILTPRQADRVQTILKLSDKALVSLASFTKDVVDDLLDNRADDEVDNIANIAFDIAGYATYDLSLIHI